jgi:hypothetical protein
MKRTLCVLLLVLPMAGQSVAPATQNTVAIADHPAHADYKAPAEEKNLLQSGAITYASGEQPIGEFCTATPEPTVSLGEIAREYRTGRPVQRPKITVIP